METFPMVTWMEHIMAIERIPIDDSMETVVNDTNSNATPTNDPTDEAWVTFPPSSSAQTQPTAAPAQSASFSIADDRDHDRMDSNHGNITDSSASSYDFSKSTMKRRASTSTPKKRMTKLRKKSPAIAQARII